MAAWLPSAGPFWSDRILTHRSLVHAENGEAARGSGLLHQLQRGLELRYLLGGGVHGAEDVSVHHAQREEPE